MKNLTPKQVAVALEKARVTNLKAVRIAQRNFSDALNDIRERCDHKWTESYRDAWGFPVDSVCRYCGAKNPNIT
jgi:hypothetical protein